MPIFYRNTILLLASFFLFATDCFSQNEKRIDSLKNALSSYAKNDTTKVVLLYNVAHQYYLNNPDSIYKYAEDALTLANRLHYESGTIAAMEAKGKAWYQMGKLDSALSIFNRGMQLCRKNINHENACVLLNDIANVYYRQGQYNNALVYYDSAIVCAEKAGNIEMAGKARSNSGSIYYSLGNYSNALNNYLQGLKIQEEIGNKAAIASDVSNIANVYFRLFQFNEAIEYNTRGKELNQAIGNKEGIIGNLTTFAMIYDAQQKYDSSLVQLNEALALSKEIKDIFTENIISCNIAECYLKKGEYGKALALYKNSITVSEQLGDAEGTGLAKAGTGESYIKLGNAKEGIKYLEEAFVIIKELGLKEQILIVTGYLAHAYETIGNYKQATDYYKINFEYRDSINRSKNRTEAEQMIFNYELQKKNDVIELLEKNEDIQASKNRLKSFLLYCFVVGFFIAVIVAFLFLRTVRTLRKSREMLRKQKNEIESQAKKLLELNNFKDNTFNVLSHDLRSPVNALTSAMMLLDEKLITPEEFAMHRHELNSKLQSVSLLLENMLYWARSQMKGEDTLTITNLHLKRKALKIIAVLKDAAMQKNISLTYDVAENTTALGDANQIEIILRNLVSNAIKFTPQGGSIEIRAEVKGDKTHISVTDTGLGLTQQQIDNLFKGTANASTMGTSGEKGTGLGLQLCYKFARNNGGQITVKSEPGKGATFTLILPNR